MAFTQVHGCVRIINRPLWNGGSCTHCASSIQLTTLRRECVVISHIVMKMLQFKHMKFTSSESHYFFRAHLKFELTKNELIFSVLFYDCNCVTCTNFTIKLIGNDNLIAR